MIDTCYADTRAVTPDMIHVSQWVILYLQDESGVCLISFSLDSRLFHVADVCRCEYCEMLCEYSDWYMGDMIFELVGACCECEMVVMELSCPVCQ